MSQTCDIGEEVLEAFNKFKRSKSRTLNAITFKINVKELRVELDEQMDDVSLSTLREDLPESVPRFVCLSYPWKLDNDRVSYPLVFVYYAPEASAKLNMLYASTKSRLSRFLDLNKEFDIHTRDELTEEWLQQKLAFFK